jgi:predicted aconitase with swiveling domain
MNLTDHEKKILDGGFGAGPQTAMRLLVTLGEVYEAERMINVQAEPIIIAAAALGNIPLVHRLDQNPLEVIRTGDFVRIDADQSIVEVTPKEDR